AGGRGRLPAWVVRIRVSLRSIACLPQAKCTVGRGGAGAGTGRRSGSRSSGLRGQSDLAVGFDEDQPLADRVVDQLGAAANAELTHDVLFMRFHRFRADEQPLGDPLVAVSLGDELQDLALTGGQRRLLLLRVGGGGERLALLGAVGDRRGEIGAGLADLLNRLQQLVYRGVLHHVAGGAGAQGGGDPVVLVVTGEH